MYILSTLALHSPLYVNLHGIYIIYRNIKMTNQEDFLSLLTEIEKNAEDILSKKQEIVDLDRKRNSNREATRSLEKEAKSHYKGDDSKC